MIRSLRKRHRRTFMILAAVLLLVLVRACMSRPEWPQDRQAEPGAAPATDVSAPATGVLTPATEVSARESMAVNRR